METVAFYSYKGGVGRSLLLANAARFLASLGKGVVALDLDFEAPGLHYKLGAADYGDPKAFHLVSGGAVPYLNATAEGSNSPPKLQDHMLNRPVPVTEGWLKLMPAGPAPGPRYWTAFKELGDKLRLGDPSGSSFMALLDLQARIAEELNPDYLLIDARTGVTELGGLATTILADVVVCMFVPNQESLDGTLTVVEALKAAHRLKHQQPIRVVPLLARRAANQPADERFDAGVERLLQLGEGKLIAKNNQALFTLPHDDAFGSLERVVGGDQKASAFSPLYKAYLELFQALFPARADRAREVLERLEAVAAIKDELTATRDHARGDDLLEPWDAKAISEGIPYSPDGKDSRYVDLLCRDDAGQVLLAVEYIGRGNKEGALAFWSNRTTLRCLVLLSKEGYVMRLMYTRAPGGGRLHEAERWDLPGPREFQVLRDVGDRSLEPMLDALQHGHIEAVGWLVSEWIEASGVAGAMHPKRREARPEVAQRILDEIGGTEDLRCAEEILHRARPSLRDFGRFTRRFLEFGELGEEDLKTVAETLFAPLFWRLPVEAVVKSLESRRYPGDRGSAEGYRLIAERLMGLRFDPYRNARDEVRARLAHSLRREDDREDDRFLWDHFHRREQVRRPRFSEEIPPALVWQEALREDPHRRGDFEDAKGATAGKLSEILKSRELRKRLKNIIVRRELVVHDLLGTYSASEGVRIYSKVVVAAAGVLGISPRYLKGVVFIHLSTWAMAYEAYDLDGQQGYGFASVQGTGPASRESPSHVAVVQAFAHRLIVWLRDANLQAAFETLSEHQPEPYGQWSAMAKLPLERLRILLLRARANAAALGFPDAGRSGN